MLNEKNNIISEINVPEEKSHRCPYMKIIVRGSPVSWTVFCVHQQDQLECFPCGWYKEWECPLNLTQDEIEERRMEFFKEFDLFLALDTFIKRVKGGDTKK